MALLKLGINLKKYLTYICRIAINLFLIKKTKKVEFFQKILIFPGVCHEKISNNCFVCFSTFANDSFSTG